MTFSKSSYLLNEDNGCNNINNNFRVFVAINSLKQLMQDQWLPGIQGEGGRNEYVEHKWYLGNETILYDIL